jgi:GxxExxY protein
MSDGIGTAIAVHRVLGPGYLESIYRKAMCVELEARRLRYEREKPIRVVYRDVEIPGQRVDLVVEELVIVELKAITHVDDVHRAQLLSYLRTAGLQAGLLLNFRVPLLKQGITRVIAPRPPALKDDSHA